MGSRGSGRSSHLAKHTGGSACGIRTSLSADSSTGWLPAHHQKLPELCESVPDTLCGVICLQNFSRKAALGPSFLEHLC